MSDQYAAITAHGGQFPVPLRCRRVKSTVSPQQYEHHLRHMARAA